jgi:hypothetical protein
VAKIQSAKPRLNSSRQVDEVTANTVTNWQGVGSVSDSERETFPKSLSLLLRILFKYVSLEKVNSSISLVTKCSTFCVVENVHH